MNNKNYVIAACLAPFVSLVLLAVGVWTYLFPIHAVITFSVIGSSVLAAYGLLLLQDEISKSRKL